MRNVLTFFCVLTSIFGVSAQELQIENTTESAKNNWGESLKHSNFHLGIDLQTKYVWRGMEMMTENSTPILFPNINYCYKGLYLYAMGGYALNGKYAEVDLGISYTWKWLTIGINDYYYPSTQDINDNYFDFSKAHTGHWLEGAITIAPSKIPAYLTISNFFYGADKTLAGKQAYSTYVEISSYYDFLNYNRLSLIIGAACNQSCYNGYERRFGICNLELKYTYNVTFKNGWSIPFNAAYIINPIRNKPFVNFSTSFAF